MGHGHHGGHGGHHHHHHGAHGARNIPLVAIQRAPVPPDVCEIRFNPGAPAAVTYTTDAANAGLTAAEFNTDINEGIFMAAVRRHADYWRWRRLLLLLPAAACIAGGAALLANATKEVAHTTWAGTFTMHEVQGGFLGGGIALMMAVPLLTLALCLLSARYSRTLLSRWMAEAVAALQASGKYAGRGLSFALYSEPVVALHMLHISRAIVARPDTLHALRITAAGRALHAPQTWLTHGTALAPAADGRMIPTALLEGPLGPVTLPPSAIPSEGSGFVLVSPADGTSPVSIRAAVQLSAAAAVPGGGGVGSAAAMQLRMVAAAGVVPGPAQQQQQMLQMQQLQVQAHGQSGPAQQLQMAMMGGGGAPAFAPAGGAVGAGDGSTFSYPVTSNPMALAQAAAASAPAYGAPPLQPPAPVFATGGFGIAAASGTAPGTGAPAYGHGGAPYGGYGAGYAAVAVSGDPVNAAGGYGATHSGYGTAPGAAAPTPYGGL